jgi:hypothetical protein
MSALAAIRALGTPGELRACAAQAASPGVPPPHNSHVHLPPNFSAFASVDQAVALAAAQGCVLLGASNYYDFSVYARFAGVARTAGILPLFGVEIMCRDADLAAAAVKVNDPGNPGKVYLCGKGIVQFEQPSPRAAVLLGRLRAADGERLAEMLRRCVAILAERGCRLDLGAASVIAGIAAGGGVDPATVVLQERHLAQALQAAQFASIPAADRLARLGTLLGAVPTLKGADDAGGLQNELRTHLMKAGKPGFVAESYLSLAEATELIAELGGLASYPVVGDGMRPPSPFEADPATLVANVKKLGVPLAEFIPPRNAPAALSAYATALRQAGVVVTAGTEHNTGELLPIDPRCAGGAAVPEAVRRIFWEGACVVAAHQFLVAHGHPGFAAGAIDEARIADFARLGAELVGRWSASLSRPGSP